MRGEASAGDKQRQQLSARRATAAEHIARGSDLRALDRLSDHQLMAVEMMVLWGLSPDRIAKRLGIDGAAVRMWLRDAVFQAAANELIRSYASGQLVPLALLRVRQLLADPFLKMRDA